MGTQSSPQAPCVAIDPLTKPRTLLPHNPDGTLRIVYLADSGEPLRYMLPNAIRVIGTTPVSVLFQAADGSWWVWSNLTAGNWILSGALPAQQVFVLATNGNVGSPWQFTDLGITLGDFYTPPLKTFVCLLCIENQFRSVRDFLSTVTDRRSVISQPMSRAQILGSQSSLPPANQNEKTAQSISELEVRKVFQRPSLVAEDHGVSAEQNDENPEKILDGIPGAYGTERQVLIGEYLLAASKLPQKEQVEAQRRLIALFEPKQ
jgi:hypothetical protein